jgi:aminoglycoside 3-N-acetyltransferase
MPLPVTSSADLDRHLAELGLAKGSRVVVHSRLISFGQIEGGAAAVYEALRRAIGEDGTLIVPTYTPALEPDTLFDPASTSSQGVGLLSEHVRMLPGAIRSQCPMHSHAAMGPDAQCLLTPSGHFSIGPGSDFELLLERGYFLLLLGCSFKEGASFIHHTEVLAKVPYRVPLDLPRKLRSSDGTAIDFPCRYYGRPTTEYCENFDLILDELRLRNVLRSTSCHFGFSHLVSLNDLHEATLSLLRKNPLALVYKGYNPYTIDLYREAGMSRDS